MCIFSYCRYFTIIKLNSIYYIGKRLTSFSCFGFGNGRFGHPEQDRAISLREAALLQTFPPSYEFVNPNEPISIDRVGKLIGNAVPVKLGEVIAQSILEHIQNNA